MELMPYFNQKGIASVFVVVVLLIGLAAGVYLVKNPQIFKSRAYESGEVKFINDFKKPYKNNKTSNIFVRLEIKPPAWQEASDSEDYEFPVLLRLSFDESKLNKETECIFTGDPKTNCQEILLDKPTDKIYSSWVLANTGENKINARFYSNKGNTKDLSDFVTYKDSGEIGSEITIGSISLQAIISSVFKIFRQVPGAAAINATTLFITHVQKAGEQVITLSQAQQLGFSFDFSVDEEGEVQFLYDPEQMSKLNMSLDFYPEMDNMTGEPKVVILPEPNPSDLDDTIQASLETALGEAGGRFVGYFINKGITSIAQSKSLKTVTTKIKYKTLKAGTPVWRTASRGLSYIKADGHKFSVLGRSVQWAEAERVLGPAKYPSGATLWREGAIPMPQRTKESIQRFGEIYQDIFDQEVGNALRAGRGAVVSREDVLRPAVKNVRNALYKFQRETGKSLPDFEARLNELAENGNAYVIGDEYIGKNAAGYFNPEFNYIVIRESSYNSYYGLHTIHHEITHMASDYNLHTNNLRVRNEWTYGGTTERERVFTAIYELMTDAWGDMATGVNIFSPTSGLQIGAYKNSYFNTEYRVFERMARQNPDALQHFLDFAINPDDDKLVNNILKTGPVVKFFQKYSSAQKESAFENFMTYFRKGQGINFGAVVFPVIAYENLNPEKGKEDIVIEFKPDFISDVNNSMSTDESQKNCPAPYPQCAKTTGLENFEQDHTILVTPKCDASGNITGYNTEDLGDRGECP